MVGEEVGHRRVARGGRRQLAQREEPVQAGAREHERREDRHAEQGPEEGRPAGRGVVLGYQIPLHDVLVGRVAPGPLHHVGQDEEVGGPVLRGEEHVPAQAIQAERQLTLAVGLAHHGEPRAGLGREQQPEQDEEAADHQHDALNHVGPESF